MDYIKRRNGLGVGVGEGDWVGRGSLYVNNAAYYDKSVQLSVKQGCIVYHNLKIDRLFSMFPSDYQILIST